MMYPIYVVSGSTGASGDQLTRTALAQFEHVNAPITVIPEVRSNEQIAQVVLRAAADDALIVHTLVDSNLRYTLVQLARKQNVVEVDVIGSLLQRMAQYLGQRPLGQPGRYRQMRQEDLKRIEAIEFAVDHDDGKRAHELHLAEIVLCGISRVGKTPVSMYLSTLGWKVANVPLVPGMEPPEGLFTIDQRRVVGLTLEPGQLVHYRRRRQQRLGAPGHTAYTEAENLTEELDFAQRIFRRGGFVVVDLTDKPVEEGASEVIATVQRRLK